MTDRAALLRTALEERLAAATGRLALPLTPSFRHDAASDPEELLRILMVRLWPRASNGVATADEAALLVGILNQLWESALGPDLRFLDAWNNVYEVMGDSVPAEVVARYIQLLEAHVRRLAP